MKKPKIVTIVGTRPEIIRLSRVIPLLDELTDHKLIHTGQNSDPNLNEIFFSDLKIRKPDIYLNINNSSLGSTLGEILTKIEDSLTQIKPDGVVILGDTNSSIAGFLAKRMQITVYHLEAGNRSFDSNVPEEINRKFIDHVADFNLAYTEHARRNLMSEGIHPRTIQVTGSPIKEIFEFYKSDIESSQILNELNVRANNYFLVSAHRQENVDSSPRLQKLLNSLTEISNKWKMPVLVSTHPRTKQRIEEITNFKSISGVIFHEPFGFFDYNKLQLNARCVLSDSGTISEESIIMGFPAITIRDSTERPEALDSGGIIMTGLKSDEVIRGIEVVTAKLSRLTGSSPAEYEIADFSQRVVWFILSTLSRATEWFGIREKST